MWKRRLLLAFLAVMLLSAIGIGVGLWLQKKTEVPGPTSTGPNAPSGELPQNQPGQIPSGQNQQQPLPGIDVNNPQVNTNAPAPQTAGPNLSLTGSLISTSSFGNLSLSPDNAQPQFYDSATGFFYKYVNSKKELLSSRQFSSATTVTWDKTGTKAFVVYSGGKAIMDFKNNREVDLPNEVYDVSFSPASDKIVFKTDSPNTRDNVLGVMNTDGTGYKFIEPIGDKGADVQTVWSPNNQVVAFFRKGTDAERQEVYFLGQNNENFKAVPLAGRGFKGSWSPDGQQVLYQVHNLDTRFTPRLYIMGGAGDNIGNNNRSLSLATTVDKCAWQNTTTVICGVPRSMPEGAGWLPRLLDDVPDSLYKIDLTSGTTSFIGWPQTGSQDLSVKNPVVSSEGKTVYFTDGLTGSLISVPLP